MSAVTSLKPAEARLPEIAGYVEAVLSDRIVGWAWSPGNAEHRVAVVLRLGARTVAEAVADQPRADLAGNGIGDGRHAFELAVPAECRGHAAELRVFAQAESGALVPIGAPPEAEELSVQVGKLLRGLDALAGSQRVIHRNLQAALTGKAAQPDAEAAATLARVVELQETLASQVGAVERVVLRLDTHLAAMTGAEKPGAVAVPPLALWALGVGGTALVVSIVGLIHSLGG